MNEDAAVGRGVAFGEQPHLRGQARARIGKAITKRTVESSQRDVAIGGRPRQQLLGPRVDVEGADDVIIRSAPNDVAAPAADPARRNNVWPLCVPQP